MSVIGRQDAVGQLLQWVEFISCLIPSAIAKIDLT